MKARFVFFIAILLLSIPSCKNGVASLTGTYSISEKGDMQEFAKVTKVNDQYFISINEQGKWQEPKLAHPVTADELKRLDINGPNDTIYGLSTQNVALIKVPKGTSYPNFTCTTGYFLMAFLGPIELYKL